MDQSAFALDCRACATLNLWVCVELDIIHLIQQVGGHNSNHGQIGFDLLCCIMWIGHWVCWNENSSRLHWPRVYLSGANNDFASFACKITDTRMTQPAGQWKLITSLAAINSSGSESLSQLLLLLLLLLLLSLLRMRQKQTDGSRAKWDESENYRDHSWVARSLACLPALGTIPTTTTTTTTFITRSQNKSIIKQT